MHGYDSSSGASKYMRWQHTWWNGVYSIMLTKVAMFHKKYLNDFVNLVPESVSKFIDDNRNCEDIAIAHVIASR
jgi:hypothetical protein